MQSTIQYIEKELSGLYPKTEMQGFIRVIFEAVLDLSFTGTDFKKRRENFGKRFSKNKNDYFPAKKNGTHSIYFW